MSTVTKGAEGRAGTEGYPDTRPEAGIWDMHHNYNDRAKS